jgi:uridine phosphorylase
MPTADGKSLHMDLSKGQIANRVVTVGSAGRAAIIAGLLDEIEEGFPITSARGFTTYTGSYKGERVSIIAIGMGLPMMDFMVRETRLMVDGPLLFIRFGTCGGMVESIPAGCLMVASEGSILVTQKVDAMGHHEGKTEEEEDAFPYFVSNVCPSDAALSEAVLRCFREALVPDASEEEASLVVRGGLNVTCDSFYSSQGRIDPDFDDRNESLVAEILNKHPSAASMEMESFQLLHLARISTNHSVRASAVALSLANRVTGEVLATEIFNERIEKGAKAVLEAIVSTSF